MTAQVVAGSCVGTSFASLLAFINIAANRGTYYTCLVEYSTIDVTSYVHAPIIVHEMQANYYTADFGSGGSAPASTPTTGQIWPRGTG